MGFWSDVKDGLMSQIGDDPRTEELRWREKLKQDEERARQRASARREAGESGYVIVWSEAPEKLLRSGQVFRNEMELGRALRAAAKHLDDDRKKGAEFPLSYYKTQVKRVSDGQERRIEVGYDEAKRKDWVSDTFD
jgi:hypothetical protein